MLYLFTDCGSENTNRTIHVVEIDNLLPSTLYYYQVGDSFYGYSDIIWFKTMTLPSNDVILPQKFLFYGDLGDTNAQCLTDIENEVLNKQVDMILHVGKCFILFTLFSKIKIRKRLKTKKILTKNENCEIKS